MSFENSAGLGVNNHYGPRAVGGEEGNIKTEGAYNEYSINVDSDQLAFGFPVLQGVVVTEVIDNFATGAITTLTIGGVDISGADGTQSNYVDVAGTNTGAVVLAGPTAGTIVIRYLRVAV